MKRIALLQLHTRSCLIIPSGDHHKPAANSQPSDYGVIKYPSAVMSSYFGPQAPLQAIRQATIQVITNTDPGIIQNLYNVRLLCISVPHDTLTCRMTELAELSQIKSQEVELGPALSIRKRVCSKGSSARFSS
jgi:hypothetical protein